MQAARAFICIPDGILIFIISKKNFPHIGTFDSSSRPSSIRPIMIYYDAVLYLVPDLIRNSADPTELETNKFRLSLHTCQFLLHLSSCTSGQRYQVFPQSFKSNLVGENSNFRKESTTTCYSRQKTSPR